MIRSFHLSRLAVVALAAALLTAAIAALSYAADRAAALAPAPFALELSGTVSSRALVEISGMAASRRRDDLLWMHNDSGRRPRIYALTQDGRALGHVNVRGATSRDWEDMASFDYEGRAMLMIADVGDNEARRRSGWLHFFEEPEVAEEGLAADATVTVEWSVPFRFGSGAADCEAVAVDVDNERVLLLTKRQNPPQFYSLPLKPDRAAPSAGRQIVATHLGSVSSIPRPSARDLLEDPMFGVYGSQPTAMDLADEQLLVLTYLHAYIYTREPDTAWAEALARPPRVIDLPPKRQWESIAFDRHGVDAYLSSEKRNAPIYRLARKPDTKSPPASPAKSSM